MRTGLWAANHWTLRAGEALEKPVLTDAKGGEVEHVRQKDDMELGQAEGNAGAEEKGGP